MILNTMEHILHKWNTEQLKDTEHDGTYYDTEHDGTYYDTEHDGTYSAQMEH